MQQAIDIASETPGADLDPDFEQLQQAKALLDGETIPKYCISRKVSGMRRGMPRRGARICFCKSAAMRGSNAEPVALVTSHDPRA